MSNLGKVADSILRCLPSRCIADAPYVVKTQNFDSRHTDLNVDLSGVDVLVFDINKIPEKISLIENGNQVKFDKEMLLMQQKDVFGIIGYHDDTPIYGSKFSVVLPVTNASSVIFEDETENRPDYKFYAIKTY